MDRQMDAQTQRHIEMQEYFTIKHFSKQRVSKTTIYNVPVDLAVIINLSRSIKENIVKNAIEDHYTTFK